MYLPNVWLELLIMHTRHPRTRATPSISQLEEERPLPPPPPIEPLSRDGVSVLPPPWHSSNHRSGPLTCDLFNRKQRICICENQYEHVRLFWLILLQLVVAPRSLKSEKELNGNENGNSNSDGVVDPPPVGNSSIFVFLRRLCVFLLSSFVIFC